MISYTKHITQVSTDGKWELSFDIDIETPEEAYVEADNQSFIKKIYNYKIVYIGTSQISVFADYRTVYAIGNDEFFTALGQSFNNITNVKPNTDVTDYIHISGLSYYTKNRYIKHDASGVGMFKFEYKVVFKDNMNEVAKNGINFVANIELNRISVMGLPSTVMSETTKRALIDGSAAIRTRLIVNKKSSVAQTFANVEETNQPLILPEDDSVKSWELNDERYVPDTGFIGQFVSRTLNGELHNISDEFSIQDADIELQIGIVELGTRYQLLTTEDGRVLLDEYGNKIYLKDLGSDTTTWYTLGNFLVTKPEDDEVSDNTKFEAFDYATKFNIDFNADYIDTQHTTSFNNRIANEGGVTLHWLASYTCAQAGVEFANTTFTNSDFTVPSNQFTQGQSCRDVMKAISEIAFGWCRIGWDNKCYID